MSNAMVIVCGSPPMMDVIKIYTILSSSVGAPTTLKKSATGGDETGSFTSIYIYIWQTFLQYQESLNGFQALMYSVSTLFKSTYYN